MKKTTIYQTIPAVILRDILDLTYEEISGILDVPLGTVKSRVNRGRARLQKILKFIGQEETG